MDVVIELQYELEAMNGLLLGKETTQSRNDTPKAMRPR